MLAARMDLQSARRWIVGVAAVVFGFGAAGNAWTTCGSHLGWMALLQRARSLQQAYNRSSIMSAAGLAGAVDLGFALFHLLFWRLFDWPDRLLSSGRINAAITQTLNVVLIYVFVVYGVALVRLPAVMDPASSPLLAAGAGFWALRIALQFVWFPMAPLASRAVTLAFVLALVLHVFAAMPEAAFSP